MRRSRTDHCNARMTLSRGQVTDNSRGVIEGNWSIFAKGRSVITGRRGALKRDWSVITIDWRDLIRDRNTIIKGWNTTARGGRVINIKSHKFYFTRGLTCCLARGRTFYFGWGLTGCAASRDRHYETQPKWRGDLQQHARQGSVGVRPLRHVRGFRPHRQRRISGLRGEYWVLKVSIKAQRCHPLPGATSPGVEEASASGIIGASGTPLSSEVDGRTPPVPPGVAPAACALCLTHASTRVEPNKKADRQLKKDQTPMSTEVQPQANTAARFADPTQGDRETIGTSAAYMSNSAFHSIK